MPLQDDAPPLDAQARYWDEWNARAREARITPVNERQGALLEAAVGALGRSDLEIVDVGCGTGWACERLARFGRVLGTDMTPQVLERARARLPHVEFVCGDFMQLELPRAHFDVAVSLEVLSHVVDQAAFVARLADLLKPGGLLVLATQNRPVMQRWSAVAPPSPAQVRHWVDARELRTLLAARFDAIRVVSVCPAGDRGLLRVVNSPRVDAIARRLGFGRALNSLKERVMLGQSLIAFGRRRPG